MNRISTNRNVFSALNVWLLAAIMSISTIVSAQVPPTSSPCMAGQLGGVAFMDMNFDGTNDATGGFAGVYVYLYDNCSANPGQPIDSVLTDATGAYHFSPTFPGNYRIEFALKGDCDHLVFGPDGASGGSDVQFVSAPGCNFNVGVADPGQYCQTNPNLIVPCFVSGEPSLPGKPTDALITWASNQTGTSGTKTSLSNAIFLGSLWGVAYSRSSELIYASPVLKTHVGLGSGGLDVIYQIDPATNTAIEWLDLGEALGIEVSDFGTALNDGQFPPNTGVGGRGLDAEPQYDAQAHTRVGKVGLGDLEISSDDKTLYFVNLFDKSLYAIDIATKTIVDGFPLAIPTPTCTGGTNRPFAIGKDEGRIYVGTLCDGGSSGANPPNASNDAGVANLSATVYRLQGLSFQQVLGPFSLAYEREPMDAYNGSVNMTVDNWFPWQDNAVIAPNGFAGEGATIYPTPLFTDIEFADNDNMILGFSDRTSFQLGFQNYGVSPSTTLQSSVAGGDILNACKTSSSSTSKNNTWSIEGAGCTSSGGHALGTNSSTYTAAGWPQTNGGIPVGEFFSGDFFHASGTITNPMEAPGHGEITIGGLVVLPKSGEVIATSFDPVTGAANYLTGGTIKLSTTTGQRTSNGFQIYGNNANTGGKGVGLGDLEAMCAVPPFQIGSYVWQDTDKDGIQDPCTEAPVVGLTVSIYDTSDLVNPVATTTTGPDGSYYFNSTQIDAGTPYYIVFGDGTSQLVEDGSGSTYVLTQSNTGEGLSPDNNDSDAGSDPNLFNGAPFIFLTSPASGSDFSFDLGLIPCTYISNPSDTQNICEGSAGADITVETGTDTPDGIRFVLFNTDQTASAVATDAEAQAIYNGTTIGAPVTPTGGSDPYTATLTALAANWTSRAPGTYYVYAVLNDVYDPLCHPVQEIVITIVDQPDVVGNDLIVCESGPVMGATINLNDLVQNPDGATLAFTEGGNPVVQPLDVGLHTIDITATSPLLAGCDTMLSVIVEVLPYPEADTICPGQTYTLTAAAGLTDVTWYRIAGVDTTTVGTGPSYMVTIPGIYYYEAADEEGCDINSCCPAVFVEGACMSIGSTVWFDNNNDGVYDEANENPIPGVTLALLNGAGLPVDDPNQAGFQPYVTTTNSNGDYLFDNLPEGMYQIQIGGLNFIGPGALVNTISSTPTDPADNQTENNDNGAQTTFGAPVLSPIIILMIATEPTLNSEFGSGGTQDEVPVPTGFADTNKDDDGDMTIDFGFVPLMSVGSTVFQDLDNSGSQGGGEAGIPGVSLQLFNENGTPYDLNPYTPGLEPYIILTDVNGNYLFDSLIPGNYYIQISTPPAGFPLSSSPAVTDTDAENQLDANDNGEQTTPGGVVTSPIFSLIPDSESDTEVGTGGAQDNGFDDNDGDMTIDFGFTPAMSLGSTVFYDPNDNGAQDADEDGISGIVIELYYDEDQNPVTPMTLFATTITNANGVYLFDSLFPGDYQVLIPTAPAAANTNSSGQDLADMENLENGNQLNPGDATSSGVITLAYNTEPTESGALDGDDQDDADDANGNMTIDFGFIPMMSLGSTVFYDVDDDGIQDPNNPLETGIAGVIVNLYDETGTTLIGTTTTDSDGNYLFDSLAPGTYIVAIPTAPLDAPTSSTGQDGDTPIDGNDNGASGPLGIQSQPIVLTPGGESTNEPGQGGTQDDGSDSNGNMTVDFGFIPNMSIGSTVWYDSNADGDHDVDGTEPGIPGAIVELLYDLNGDGNIDPSEIIATSVTDVNGNYLFDSLPSGEYVVAVTPVPDANTSAVQLVAADDNGGDGLSNGSQLDGPGSKAISPVITLSPGTEPFGAAEEALLGEVLGGQQDNANDTNGDMTVDFGFIPMMSLGSTVFYDVDDDGVQDPNNPLETGIAGVTVYLYDATGTSILDSTITDADGNYLFDSLSPGTYVVGVVAPDDAQTSSTGAGGDDDVDGNDNGGDVGAVVAGVSQSGPIVLTAGGETANEDAQGGTQDDGSDTNGNMTVDFGFIPTMSIGSTVYYDNNNNGAHDTLETGIQGAVVELLTDLNGDGTIDPSEVIATTVTDVNGTYLFDTLPAGQYIVKVTPTAEANTSSLTAVAADDNGGDGLNNGTQIDGPGSAAYSPVITLTPGMEPDAAGENNPYET
ncbi:MAG: hypothetical protein KDC49_19320, partial [Saprospiraceae bacterium]|nr:hypothetical protein [Saprospiraceae bacterium]